ncbi:MAG: lysophospholipid acyltransferase family protein [Pseudomonadota bacterium]
MAKSSKAERQNKAAEEVLARYSPRVSGFFERYLARYFAKNFHGFRIAKGGEPPEISADRGLVVFNNHSSWWDPLVMFYMSRSRYGDRCGFGPIDAEAVQKYKFMLKIGLFPVEQDTARGAVQFLNVSHGLLSHGGTSLWLTPQGEFADARRRPADFKPGIAHLARDCANVSFVPMALEYCFWNESKPELLVRFGTPVEAVAAGERSTEEWQSALERALEETQDALKEDAISRDPDRFTSVLSGEAGVGFAYDAWRRLKALVTGKKFSAAHEDGPA